MFSLLIDADSLLYWQQRPRGDHPLRMDEPSVNPSFVAAVVRYHERHPEDAIIIWSSLGMDYARIWGEKFLSALPYSIGTLSDAIPGDLVVAEVVTTNLVCPVMSAPEFVEFSLEESV